jgi:starch synthase (maltosyl-transferring)
VNAIRRENRALQSNDGLRFHSVDNDHIICYSKQAGSPRNLIVTVVNLDPHWTQSGFVELPLDELGIDIRHPYRVVDLLGGGRFMWQGPRNYVELRPTEMPAHILRLE